MINDVFLYYFNEQDITKDEKLLNLFTGFSKPSLILHYIKYGKFKVITKTVETIFLCNFFEIGFSNSLPTRIFEETSDINNVVKRFSVNSDTKDFIIFHKSLAHDLVEKEDQDFINIALTHRHHIEDCVYLLPYENRIGDLDIEFLIIKNSIDRIIPLLENINHNIKYNNYIRPICYYQLFFYSVKCYRLKSNKVCYLKQVNDFIIKIIKDYELEKSNLDIIKFCLEFWNKHKMNIDDGELPKRLINVF